MGSSRPSLDYPEQAVSLLVVEHAARALRKRMAMFLALNAALAVGVFVAGIPTLPLFFLLWLAPALHGFIGAGKMLRAVADPEATAVRRGATIKLRTPRGLHVLALTPDELASARQHALPPAAMV